MSRSLEQTQPVLLASGAFVTLFTVPTGHKYELVGTTLTMGTIVGTQNAAGLHTFASTAAALDWFEQSSPATVGVVLVDNLSEVFQPGDSYAIIWATGTGNGQGFCWYVDVNYAE